MPEPCTVIVGASDLHDALRERAGASGEVLIFSDVEALKALDTITVRRPRVIALERLFAATSRGAALINRIKADPALSAVEIRIVAHDGTYARVSPRRTPSVPPPAIAVLGQIALAPEIPPAAGAATAIETVEPPVPLPEAYLDYAITRRAFRFRMVEGTPVQVDGTIANVVDLSAIGAQILSPAPLKPAQQIRIALVDDLGVVKFSGFVAWALFEIPKGVSRYRAGIEFKGAEAKALEAFCRRHKT
jgi:hypothetical protein